MIKEKIIFPSRQSVLNDIDKFCHRVTDPLNISGDNMDALMIVVTELINNAIIHGNKKDESKKVVFEISGDKKELLIRVKDEGSGFNENHIPDPTVEENILKTSGRGIYIVKHMVKSFSHYMDGDYHVTEVIFHLNEIQS